LSFYYELFEIALFAELGVLQFICAQQRYYTHVLSCVFGFVDCALLAIILRSSNPFDRSSIPPALAMDSSRFVLFFLLLMQSIFSDRPRLVLWCGYWHCWLGLAVFDNGRALDMIAALEHWNAERAAAGAAPVRVGFGLHYGPVIAGDIGDSVCIACRLEHQTRSLNSPLVVSGSLMKSIARRRRCAPVAKPASSRC
jgi:hypothetical protein